MSYSTKLTPLKLALSQENPLDVVSLTVKGTHNEELKDITHFVGLLSLEYTGNMFQKSLITLTSLKTLKLQLLYNTKEKSKMISDISQMSSLTHLEIKGSFPAFSVAQLINLQYLSLIQADLSIPPDGIEKLPLLKTLILKRNSMSYFNISPWSCLEVLDLSSNKLKNISYPPEALNKLTTFDVSNNTPYAYEVTSEHLKLFPNLTYFGTAQKKSIPLNPFIETLKLNNGEEFLETELTHLTALDLGDYDLRSYGQINFKHLTNLQKLDLNCFLTKLENPEELLFLNKLEILNLSRTLTVDAKMLEQFKLLKELYATDCQGSLQVSELPLLEKLHISRITIIKPHENLTELCLFAKLENVEPENETQEYNRIIALLPKISFLSGIVFKEILTAPESAIQSTSLCKLSLTKNNSLIYIKHPTFKQNKIRLKTLLSYLILQH